MDAADLLPDPLAQFALWLDGRRAAGVEMPEAMTLATADAAGRPSARTVLLKGADAGVPLLHEHGEPQGRELAENPSAALVFHWPQQPRRQVTVFGAVEPLPREEAEAYFRTRPLGSRLGAWASRQTTVIARRDSSTTPSPRPRPPTTRRSRPGGAATCCAPSASSSGRTATTGCTTASGTTAARTDRGCSSGWRPDAAR